VRGWLVSCPFGSFDRLSTNARTRGCFLSSLGGGKFARRRASSHRLRLDTNNARNLLDGESDPLHSRRYAESLANSVLLTNWPAVLTIADEMVQSRLKNIDGDAVERIARDAGARKHPTKSKGRRPISRAEFLARLTPEGRRAVLGTVAGDEKRIEKR
jgi:hypothetical protein